MTKVPQFGVPEIFVHGEDDDVAQAKKFAIPSVSITPVEHDRSDTAESLGVGRAPASGSEAGGAESSAPETVMRHRSGSIQNSEAGSEVEGSDQSPSARHKPSPSSGSIQPDWHFAAAMEGAAPGHSPPGSPHLSVDGGNARSRSGSAVSQNEMMGMFTDSAWGQSMRRSVTTKKASDKDKDRRPSHE
ncbi:hypothetical protein KC329_g9322 [Hortaea werneckii]|nr:hypothetical protein KC329_g9322 [Hortaea werneckii]